MDTTRSHYQIRHSDWSKFSCLAFKQSKLVELSPFVQWTPSLHVEVKNWLKKLHTAFTYTFCWQQLLVTEASVNVKREDGLLLSTLFSFSLLNTIMPLSLSHLDYESSSFTSSLWYHVVHVLWCSQLFWGSEVIVVKASTASQGPLVMMESIFRDSWSDNSDGCWKTAAENRTGGNQTYRVRSKTVDQRKHKLSFTVWRCVPPEETDNLWCCSGVKYRKRTS